MTRSEILQTIKSCYSRAVLQCRTEIYKISPWLKSVLNRAKIIKPDVLSVIIIRLVRLDTVTGDYRDNRWAKCENDPLGQLYTTQPTFRPFGGRDWSDFIFVGGGGGGGGGRVVEMSIFTDEIISREADNIRDIISGAISIFISQRQQRQPTNIIKPHSRAFSRGSLGQLNICRD